MVDSESTSKSMQSGCVLSEFKEVNEVKNIIQTIPNIYGNQISVETACEKVIFIFDEYQEQPHLLDPHLEGILGDLLAFVKDTSSPPEVIHLAFKFVYLLTKTRGFKNVVRLMPHEVADLEPVLALLAKQDLNDHQTWESRYVLLLWLSMVSMIPFDMVRLDSNIRSQTTGEVKKPVMERIIDVGMSYMGVSDKSRDAAAYMLSRFMTRPDVRKEKLPNFLDWSIQNILQSDKETISGMSKINGLLTTLSLLFKHGKREDLVDYAPVILKELDKLELHESPNTLLRKMNVKFVQRLGLTFLKSKVAAWRYQRGSRSLAENLQKEPGSGDVGQGGSKTAATDEEEEYDIPDEMEDIIEKLLSGLKDKDTIVRWSAAKGIGRVTGRLPHELADEVVGSIMDLFTIAETDSAWHGGCLSLAELGRRGLLLPARLPNVVPVIIKALQYDEKRGNFSVGAHVRDAACYVCWAFARAYEPHDFKPYMEKVATALVIVSVFDREVNVRRAAAAAFQENVGRQGQFPHGIDILTTCDYFAVGNRINCYTELSVFVGQFSEYTQALIDHLANVTIGHWDTEIRELTAQGLNRLTACSPDYMAQTILPSVIKKCMDMDLNLRHGAIMTAAEVMHALTMQTKQGTADATRKSLDECSIALKDITPQLSMNNMFKGVGGEMMRKASCSLIRRLAECSMPYHGDPVIASWQELIDDCLEHTVWITGVQVAAVEAIPAFFSEYYQDKSAGTPKLEMQEQIISKYLKGLQSNVETTRMGYALAIGAFPKFFMSGKLDTILASLTKATVITEKESKWAESRRDVIKALTRICLTVGVDPSGSPLGVICRDNIQQFYDTLFLAMRDYTLDSRGDIGACVREASMSGLETVVTLTVAAEPSLITPQISKNVFCHLVQQASEKIDRTRAHAGEIFARLLYHSPEIPNIPHKDDLQRIFPKDKLEMMLWLVPAETFPKFTELNYLPDYRYSVLLGLTVSVGGLTESLVHHSSWALLTYLRNIKQDATAMQDFVTTLMAVFKDHQKQDRVSVPMLKMLDKLISNGTFNLFVESESQFPMDLYNQTKQEITKSGDPQKILASIEIFCGLLQFSPEVRKKCLTQLSIFMCHKYPIVRRASAHKLYEATVAYDGIVPDESMDEVMTLLSETQWDRPIPEVKPIRNQLCDLLSIPKPVVLNKANVTKDEDK